MEKNAKISFTIDAEIQALQNKLKAAKKEAEWLTSSDYGKGLEKTFTKIENSITRLQQKAASPVMSDRMFDGLQNELNSVGVSVKNLIGTVDSLGELSRRQKIELLPAGERDKFLNALKTIDDFIDKEAQFKTESQQLTKARRDLADAQDNLTEAIGKQADKQALLNKAQQKETNAKAVLDAAQARVDALEDQEQAAKELSDELQRVAELYEKFGGDKRKKADFTTPEGETVNYQAAKKAAKEANENLPTQEIKQAAQLDLDKAQQEYKDASKEVTNFTRQLTSADTRVKTLQQSIVRLTDSVSTLEAEWATSSEKDRADAFRELRNEAEQLGLSLDDIGDDASTENIDKLKTSLNNFVDDGVFKVNTGLDESKKEFNSINPVLETTKDEVEDGREAWRAYNEQVSNTNAMVSRIKQFVGMEGAITAMRAAVRNAMQSIKELDATMTEMSVVTDLGVEDYWNQLPEHTQRANRLGVAINDIYKAETLYYQQGLKTNEVTEMSAETLKMARIAGLSAEDATNKMTAALRGFNMELNETSAKRISDVYSELAAITASDVDEISSAMTKTASIASSAGMEFETTAAFLSQIIETTRESAETAGTALKTVVARFQELKKDPAEIGEVEGEVVDANKIEAALRSVNVALRDTSGQFRDLDDVFLELASKWSTLDTNTQRYIATIAAGSRQQSRFIAMMSNYGRTTELVNAANNSAGASNQQFEKTLDSLDAKLSQLENAFNEFSMGIMNSALLKKGVDALTQLFNIINNISKGWNGLTGSLSKVGVIFSAIKLGEALIKKFLANINTGITSMGTNLGNSIAQGVTEGMNKAKGIVTDAVDEMNGKVQSSQPVSAPQATTGFIQQKLQQKTEGIKQAVTGFAQTEMPTQYKKITPVFGTEGLQKFASETTTSLKDALEKSVRNVNFDTNKFKKNLFPESLWDGVQKQFTKKMSAMGKSTDEISEAWTKVTGEANNTLSVIDGLDKELEDAFEVAENPMKGDDTYKKITADVEGLTDKEKNLGEIRTQIAAKGQVAYNNLTQGMMKCGVAATAVGVAFGTIGAYLEGMGLEEAGQAFTDLGNILTVTGGTLSGFSGILSALKPIVAKLTVALGSAALAAGAVTIAIIALVAIVGVLVWAFKNAQANSPEGKLKAAEEAAEKAGEAADRASEAYNNLKTSLDSLDSGYEVLEDLTYGTEEWKEQVEKLNEEVKTLLKNYPELAKYVTLEDGVLKLDFESDEVQGILDKYANAEVRAKAMETGQDIAVIQQKKENYQNDNKTLRKIIDGAIGMSGMGEQAHKPPYGFLYTATNAIYGEKLAVNNYNTSQEANAAYKAATKEVEDFLIPFAEAYFSGAIIENEDNGIEIIDQQALNELGITYTEEEITRFFSILTETGKEAFYKMGEESNIQVYLDQISSLYTQLSSDIINGMDLTRFTEEERDLINNLANNEALLSANYQSQLDDLKDATVDSLAEELQKTDLTATVEVDGDQIKVKGKEDKEFKTYEKEEAKSMVAMGKVVDDLTKSLKQAPKAFAEFKSKFKLTGDSLEKIFSNESLNNWDIEKLEGRSAEIYWEQMNDEIKAFFDNDLEQWRQYKDNFVETSKKAIEDFNATMSDLDGGDYFKNKINAQTADRYNTVLEDILSSSGTTAAKQFNDTINSLLEKQEFSTEDIEKFFEVITNADFEIKNYEDWENLPTLLEEAGLNIPNNELETFIKDARDAAGAIEQVDMSKLQEEISNLSKVAAGIESGEQGRTFSEETYKSLLDSGVIEEDQFIKNLNNEYVYLGTSMEKLRTAIVENTNALLGRASDTFANYDLLKRLIEKNYSDGESDITKYYLLDETAQRDLLQQFLTQFKNSGGKLSELTDGRVADNADIEEVVYTIDEEKMNAIFHTITTKVRAETDTILNDVKNSWAAAFQSEDFNANISGFRNELTGLFEDIENGTQSLEKDSIKFLERTSQLAARMGTIATKALEAGVSESTLQKYNEQISAFNELQKEYTESDMSLEEYIKRLKEWEQTYIAAENSIEKMVNADTTAENLENMMTKLAAVAKQMEETTDITLLTSQASKALEQFGIDVSNFTEQEILDIKGYILSAVKGGAEGATSLMKIVELAAASYGMSIKAFTTEATLESAKAVLEFANLLVSLGIGKWEDDQFVFTMAQAYQDTVNQYGNPPEDKKKGGDGETEEIEYWESDYDWLYNYNEEINYLIREREKSERAYQKALQDSSATAEDLYNATKDHLEELKGLANVYTLGAEKALLSIQEMFNDPINAEFVKYVKFDPKTNKITIDDTGLSNVKFTTEVGKNFQNFLAALEKNRQEIQKAEDGLQDIEDDVESIEDLQDKGREALADIYDDVKAGLVKERRDQLDAIRENTEAINEAERALMESLQEQINEMREARDNAKTEKDLNSKRAKLAYLKRDTSGMYGLDILSLEKEIAEQEEQYTDQLIDQKLQDLQEASDEAIEQRNKQIELQEKELDAWENGSAIWSEVERIVNESLSNDRNWENSEAARLIALGNDNINPIREELEAEEWDRKVNLARSYLNQDGGLNFSSLKEDALEVLGAENTKLAGIKEDLGVQGNGDIEGGTSGIMGGVNSINKWEEDDAIGTGTKIIDGSIDTFSTNLSNLIGEYFGKDGALSLLGDIFTQAKAIANKIDAIEIVGGKSTAWDNPDKKTTNTPESYAPTTTTWEEQHSGYKTLENSYNNLRLQSILPEMFIAKKTVTYTKTTVEDNIVTLNGVKYFKNGSDYYKMSDVKEQDQQAGNKKFTLYYWPAGTTYYQFEKGGLADFTGPAWLDGTKASPELILNAQDTRNFIMLKDVLSDILSGTSTIKHSSTEDGTKGDNYYEIEINVDSLSDDYDVDQLASKIKSMIYEDSIYRNVNTVNLLR